MRSMCPTAHFKTPGALRYAPERSLKLILDHYLASLQRVALAVSISTRTMAARRAAMELASVSGGLLARVPRRVGGFTNRVQSRECESLIPVRYDLLAFAAIVGEAALVGHEDPRFAGDVGAKVPAVGGSLQTNPSDLLVMVPPLLFRLWLGLDRCVVVSAHIGKAVGDPVDMLLDSGEHVGEDRRAAGSGDGEQVREVGDEHSHDRGGLGIPFVPQQ